MSSASVHSVHFYESDIELLDRLRGVIVSGLQIGNSILVVATAEHREQLVKKLESLDVDLRGAARDGSFTMLDAGQVLKSFIIKGRPNPLLFEGSLGKVVDDAKRAARGRERNLTVFGEMVAVLWADGNRKAALELEALWNDIMEQRAFHLHCAYPRRLFNGDATDLKAISSICRAHSHVLLTESEPAQQAA